MRNICFVYYFSIRYLDRQGILCYTNTRKDGDQMSLASELIRGRVDAVILANLMNRDSYGYEINKSILKKSSGRYELNEATLYTAFKRLIDLGYITTYWGGGDVGARRKYYRITTDGKDAYYRMLEEWQTAKQMLDAILSIEEASK